MSGTTTIAGRILTGAAAVAIVALMVVGLWTTRGDDPVLTQRKRKPYNIMGTQTKLVAVAPADRGYVAERAVRDAERALRDVEAKMSRRLDDSEIGRFNLADPQETGGAIVPMSTETMTVLRESRKMWQQTGNAFDVTVGALGKVWRDANELNELPHQAQIEAARAASNWSLIELLDGGVRKLSPSVRLDLGGIAKGYGIDRAVEAIRQTGCSGGLVDVGGDVRCFGRPPKKGFWLVAVQDPFDPDPRRRLATLKLNSGALCTSGNYRRGRNYKIAGKRYSHIIDPRPGPMMGMALPPEATPASVTVFAPTAMAADAWATALSVLGVDGLKMIPPGSDIEAMLVIGDAEVNDCVVTPGFRKLFAAGPLSHKPEPATLPATPHPAPDGTRGSHGPSVAAAAPRTWAGR